MNGEPCIRTTEDPRPKCLFEKPVSGCICNTGFVRDLNTKQCQPITTGLSYISLLCNEFDFKILDFIFLKQKNQSNVNIMKPIHNVVRIVP